MMHWTDTPPTTDVDPLLAALGDLVRGVITVLVVIVVAAVVLLSRAAKR